MAQFFAGETHLYDARTGIYTRKCSNDYLILACQCRMQLRCSTRKKPGPELGRQTRQHLSLVLTWPQPSKG